MKSSSPHIDLSAVAAKLPLTPLAVLLSCVFSLAVILQHPLLNDDAYKYLRAAELFNSDGARAVLESFEWFNYAILIALVDKVLPGGAIAAAHTLDTALYALLTYAFMLLVRELRDTPLVRLFAAACILALPLTNEMRFFLIRDAGYWAFALLSLVFLIRHNRDGAPKMAFYWSITLLAACVFRLEGLLLLALAPLSLLLPDTMLSLQERANRCGRLVGILAAVVLSVLLVSMLAGISLPDLIGYAYRHYLPRLSNLPALLGGTAGDVGAALFTPDNYPGSDNTGLTLATALFGYCLALIMTLVEALSLPFVILLLAGRFFPRPFLPPVQARRALGTYVAVTAASLLLFILIMHFMTQRYVTLLALLLLTQAPLLLDDLHARVESSPGQLRHFYIGVVAIGFFFLIDSLVSFGYSNRHIEDGIAWTRERLPEGAQLRTNNFAIAYHSGRIPDYELTVRDAAQVAADSNPGDYLLLEVDRGAALDVIDSDPALVPLQRFTNERDDAVLVYLHR